MKQNEDEIRNVNHYCVWQTCGIIGDDYSKNIINVETELFDSHSIAFDKTIFMKLEECNGASTRKYSDMFKSLITAKSYTINPKGMKKYMIEAYPHIMATTNQNTPVKVEPNDRRFCISYTSSDYIGNRDFWKETYRLFDLPQAGFVIYNYLMEQDLTDFIAQEFPKTDYHQSLALYETPSEELFLKESKSFNSLKAVQLHEEYLKYCEDQHLHPKSVIGFSRAISPFLEQGIITRRMKDGYALYSKIKKDPIYSASLDRIDSNKGYEKGNIQWISRSMNYMKNDMTDQEVRFILNLIKKNVEI
jgi:hypothetical protein